MNAYCVGYSLVCEGCGYVLQPEQYEHKKRPGVVYVRCATSHCAYKGKIFKFPLQTIALEETDFDPYEADIAELMAAMNKSAVPS